MNEPNYGAMVTLEQQVDSPPDVQIRVAIRVDASMREFEEKAAVERMRDALGGEGGGS